MHRLWENVVEFCSNFLSAYDKVILAIMLGEMMFILTYDMVGISSSVVLPTVFGSLISAAFLVDRNGHSNPERPLRQP